MSLRFPVISSAAAFIGLAQLAFAHSQTVELSAIEGDRTIRGDLVSVKNGKFVVETSLGVVSVEQAAFRCEGLGCPADTSEKLAFTLAGPADVADLLVPVVAEGFAAVEEMNVHVVDVDGMSLHDHAAFGENGKGRFEVHLENEEEQTELRFGVEEASGARGFDLLVSGGADMVISEASVPEEVVRAAQAAGRGNLRDFAQEQIIAVDGFVAIVNRRMSLSPLTVEQMSQVFAGEITNWAELGGPDHKIHVYSLEPDNEKFHLAEQLLLTPFKRTISKDARFVKSDRELSRAVEEDLAGFGFVRYSAMRDTVALPVRKSCGLVVQPDPFTMKAEEYPLQHRVALYAAADMPEEGAALWAYMGQPSVDDLLTKTGLVSLAAIRQSKDEQLANLRLAMDTLPPEARSAETAEYVSNALSMHRLSTAFRFSSRSAQLDNKAQRDVLRIAEYIRSNRPRRIVLAGFADSEGAFDMNRSLSLTRAQQVQTALGEALGARGFGKTEVLVRGYGEIAPVACNSTPKGRATNRRVEIWSE